MAERCPKGRRRKDGRKVTEADPIGISQVVQVPVAKSHLASRQHRIVGEHKHEDRRWCQESDYGPCATDREGSAATHSSPATGAPAVSRQAHLTPSSLAEHDYY